MPPDHENFLGKARLLVGAKNVLTDPHDLIKFCKDWRGRYAGSALAVILPKTTAEVAAIVQLCRDSFVSIVPQAGNTGTSRAALCRWAVTR